MKTPRLLNFSWTALSLSVVCYALPIAADDNRESAWKDRVKSYMRLSSETLIDTTNQAPQVGRLVLNADDGFGHGSGFLVVREDESRDKILTSAHNFFDDEGELRAPLSRWRFELGIDTNNSHTEMYGLKRIKCATSDPFNDLVINDQCLVTLDREIADNNLALLEIWQGNHEKLVGEITTYFVGYHGYSENSKTKRTLNRCKLIHFDKYSQVTQTDCNSSKGMSGGVHGIVVEGELQVIGIITGTFYDKSTGKIVGNYSVPILDEYNKNLIVSVTRKAN